MVSQRIADAGPQRKCRPNYNERTEVRQATMGGMVREFRDESRDGTSIMNRANLVDRGTGWPDDSDAPSTDTDSDSRGSRGDDATESTCDLDSRASRGGP